MNRYQRFVENKKKEGKKRRSLWCTDEEWTVIKYLFDHLDLEDINIYLGGWSEEYIKRSKIKE